MDIISVSVMLFLIMDPMGNLPIFSSVLRHVEKKRRRVVLIRELLFALAVMLLFFILWRKDFKLLIAPARSDYHFWRNYFVPNFVENDFPE